MSGVSGVAQQGVISTQVERVQNDRPVATTEAPRPVEASQPPPPPPSDSGRGATVDTSA